MPLAFELHQWVNVFFCFKMTGSRLSPLYKLWAIVPMVSFLSSLFAMVVEKLKLWRTYSIEDDSDRRHVRFE